jgi:chromosomal replication initiator protein
MVAIGQVPHWTEWMRRLRETFSDKVFQQHFARLRPRELTPEQVLVIEVPPDADRQTLTSFLTLGQGLYTELHGSAVQFELVEEALQVLVEERPTFSDLPRESLRPDLCFENFVIGSNSEFAFHAAEAVAENPGTNRFNPLLIYGRSGLGKTHLLQSIAHRVKQIYPDKRVCYISAEQFTKEFVAALPRHDRISALSHYYRNQVDVLLVDDIHHLSGRDATQNEFFHIFNAMHLNGRQIAMTCDTEPSQVKGLEERLISRFQWGLVVDIQPPDVDTREAILRRKAESGHLDLPDEVVAYIAHHVDSHVRALEAVVTKLLFRASVRQEDITIEMCRDVLAGLGQSSRPRANADQIVSEVADYYQLDMERIFETGRGTQEIARARQVCMYLLKEASSLSLKSIGARFAGRDHTTVIHAIKTVQKLCEEDVQFRREIEGLKQKFG